MIEAWKMETALVYSPLIRITEETRNEALDPDARLMLRFKDGDMEAFERLFMRHMHPIVSFAYRFVRNREVAEELAQEIFLKVHDAAASYRVQAKFTTWLYRIATNVCLNEVRRPHFRNAHQSLDANPREAPDEVSFDLEDKGAVDPEKLLQRQAIAQALRQALGQIPEKQRIAFILSKYQELSYVEVAEIMKISEKAVKSLIHRAKEALAEGLKPLLPEL
jgi:RNA polymerase sigma-70 factor (ECF subfamily)